MSPEAMSNVGPGFGEDFVKAAQRGAEDRVAQGFDAQVTLFRSKVETLNTNAARLQWHRPEPFSINPEL